MSSGNSSNPIPFEPRQKKKKTKAKASPPEAKSTPKPEPPPKKRSQLEELEAKEAKAQAKRQKKNRKKEPQFTPEEVTLSAIPEEVSRRMIRRMALFSGIPTVLGLSSFLIFYLIVGKGGVEIPTVAVLIVTLLFFGLGVVGLSYGIFSTSWDENYLGSLWGWEEFRLNFKRTVSAWKTAKRESKKQSES